MILVREQHKVISVYLPIGVSHTLTWYDLTMDHNRIHTVGNQVLSDNRMKDLTDFILIAAFLASSCGHYQIINITEIFSSR